MSPGEFIRLQAVEIVFLSMLAFLPYFVALKEFGLTLLIMGLSIGGYRMAKKHLAKRVSIEGKSVFITGCDTGFGHALAQRLASLGFRVFAGCLRPDCEGAQSLKAMCGEPLHIVPLDIGSDDSVANALKYVKRHMNGTDFWGVVNNAGIDIYGDAELCTVDMYKRIMDINMFGTVRVTRSFLPLIRRSKGRVLIVTSVKGRLGAPQSAPYTMSKYAAEGFADVLRIEMRQWGVKVILIEPGNFGATTSITKNENRERIARDLETMWNEASPEVREDYGKDYHLENMRHTKLTNSPNSVAPVIDAMEDALLNEEPKARYMIGGSTQVVDVFKTCVLMSMFLPDTLIDYIIDGYLWTRPFVPQALRSS